MATVGAFAARVGEVGISNAAWTPGTTVSAMTFNDIEKVNNPRTRHAQDTAESSSNDSGGEKEHVNTWRSGDASFEMISSIGATRQEEVWTAYIAGNIMGWRFRPSGGVSGDPQLFFAATIENIEETGDKGDVGKRQVSLKRTGGLTRSLIP